MEPRYNEPLYNEVIGIKNDFLYPHNTVKPLQTSGTEESGRCGDAAGLYGEVGVLYDLRYYMKNFCNSIGLEQWYFSLI